MWRPGPFARQPICCLLVFVEDIAVEVSHVRVSLPIQAGARLSLCHWRPGRPTASDEASVSQPAQVRKIRRLCLALLTDFYRSYNVNWEGVPPEGSSEFKPAWPDRILCRERNVTFFCPLLSRYVVSR